MVLFNFGWSLFCPYFFYHICEFELSCCEYAVLTEACAPKHFLKNIYVSIDLNPILEDYSNSKRLLGFAVKVEVDYVVPLKRQFLVERCSMIHLNYSGCKVSSRFLLHQLNRFEQVRVTYLQSEEIFDMDPLLYARIFLAWKRKRIPFYRAFFFLWWILFAIFWWRRRFGMMFTVSLCFIFTPFRSPFRFFIGNEDWLFSR